MNLRRLDVPTLRAAWWARSALRSVRAQLRDGSVLAVSVPQPPAIPEHGTSGVDALLRRAGASCLERSLVRQRWLAAHGRPLELLVGVRDPDDFEAHAWLAGEEGVNERRFTVITRLAP